VSDEVAHAIATDKPVVALESTIYTHGRMGKELAQEHEELVRSHGVPKVGVSPQEIVRMIDSWSTVKVSRRDISYLVGMVSPSSPAWRSVQAVILT
jgi:pseudouridine-5'-phosphate glycosidase/pseudouridine kinase